jgi:deoxyribose-phosphate aldolase
MVALQSGALPRATHSVGWQHEAGTQSASLVQAAPVVGCAGAGSEGAVSPGGTGCVSGGSPTWAGPSLGGVAGSAGAVGSVVEGVDVYVQPSAESAHRKDSDTASVLVIGESSWVRLRTMPAIGSVDHPSQLSPLIDHTLLKPDATAQHIEALCHEATRYRFFAVCVNGAHVARAAALLAGTGVEVAAVVGFPLGAMATAVKAREAEVALRDGARELDMVLRIDLLKQGDDAALGADIAAVVGAAGGALVKVILETSLLDDAQIVRACRVAEQAGARFVKTCTGFTPGGEATVEHVRLMRASVSAVVGVKASGGIRSFERARELVAAGATRLGTSSGVALVSGGKSETAY